MGLNLNQTSGRFRGLASWSVVTVAAEVLAGLRRLEAALPVEELFERRHCIRPTVDGFLRGVGRSLFGVDICPGLLGRSSTSAHNSAWC